MTKKHRDAGTGEYVTADYAGENPETTVSEADSPDAQTRADARRWRWYQFECTVPLDEMDSEDREGYADAEIARIEFSHE